MHAWVPALATSCFVPVRSFFFSASTSPALARIATARATTMAACAIRTGLRNILAHSPFPTITLQGRGRLPRRRAGYIRLRMRDDVLQLRAVPRRNDADECREYVERQHQEQRRRRYAFPPTDRWRVRHKPPQALRDLLPADD